MASKSKFDKVLGSKDIIAIAFGAMIGWGWVINSGDWLSSAGFIGSIIAFLIGGIMVFFVGLTYAELTAALPQCGGEHVFSYKAMGPNGSFVCTWAIILGYMATAAFEAAALPTVIRYILGDAFDVGYLYTINGADIYIAHVIVGVVAAIIITYINIIGIKTAAIVQTIMVVIILGVAILLIIGSVINGDTANITENLFGIGKTLEDKGTIIGGIFTVACMTPFLFIGFDVIPQAAEEIKIAYKKIGGIMLLSIGMAVVFYFLVIFAVANSMSVADIENSMANGLVTADAMAKVFNADAMANVLIIGGMCGILTSWNSFLLGGSRAMYSMGVACMIPKSFGTLHPKYKTPVKALLLGGFLCCLAPFFGRPVLLWLVDAASFGCCVAYLFVSISFLMLRYKQPDMRRPYVVKNGKVVGVIAIIMSGFLTSLYIIPADFGCALTWEEWIVVGAWILLGVFFFIYCKKKYGKEFGSHIEVEMDENLL